MAGWNRMAMFTAEVNVPMRMFRLARLMRMRVPMDIDASSPGGPERHGTKPDEQEASNRLASPLHDDRNVPAQHEHARRPDRQQQRMTQRESQGNAHRAGIPRLLSCRSGGQRGNRHEMISAETVKESEGENRDAQHKRGIITGSLSRGSKVSRFGEPAEL